MKSRFNSAGRFCLILTFICAVSIGTAAAGHGGRWGARPSGHLVVLRSPNFGWNLAFNLQIDGRTVANLVQGRRYNQLVPAGRHVLTVSAVPNAYYSEPISTVLNVRSGQTYVFTALWDGSNRVVLVPSALPPGQSY